MENNIVLETNIQPNVKVPANDNLSDALQYLLRGAIGAIEYTKPKEKHIRVSLVNSENTAKLSISDTAGDVSADNLYTGIGIERAKEGGILYFIARRIIFDHNGAFDIRSYNRGQGTTFTIELPIAKENNG